MANKIETSSEKLMLNHHMNKNVSWADQDDCIYPNC